MIKIGVLTFHRSINTGAFMQCYGLINRLIKDFPECNIKVIDYETKTSRINYSDNIFVYSTNGLCFRGAKNFIRSSFITFYRLISLLFVHPKRMRDRRKNAKIFKQALNYLPLTDFSIVSDDYRVLFDRIKKEFDIVIVGSDCVWQYVGYPFPNAYLLNFDSNMVKMSYAACAYRIDLSKMSEENLRTLRNSISSLDYIGIRDEQTRNIIGKLNIKNKFHHNCDPAFFVDLCDLPATKDDLRQKLISRGIDLNKPIIGIQLRNDEIALEVKKFFGDDYQFIAIRERNRAADLFFDGLSPFEWSIVFSFFAFTVTDYFHATLFSIKNHVCPIVFDNKTDFYDGEISRVEDLMKRMELSNCYISYKKGSEKSLNIESVINAAKQVNTGMFDEVINREMNSYDSFREFLHFLINEADEQKI